MHLNSIFSKTTITQSKKGFLLYKYWPTSSNTIQKQKTCLARFLTDLPSTWNCPYIFLMILNKTMCITSRVAVEYIPTPSSKENNYNNNISRFPPIFTFILFFLLTQKGEFRFLIYNIIAIARSKKLQKLK